MSTLKSALLFLGTFLLVFVMAKVGQYFFDEWPTASNFLWPSTSIAFAIVWFWGYQHGLPIFLALCVAAVTGSGGYVLPDAFILPGAEVFAVILAKYILHRLDFDDAFSSIADVVKFFVVALTTSLVATSIGTLLSPVLESLTVPTYVLWGRVWTAYIFSFFIVSPLILTWGRNYHSWPKANMAELGFLGVVLIVATYLLFWNPIQSNFDFLFFLIFFAAHTWMSFRFSTRLVALSIFVTTVFGILGLLYSPNPGGLFSGQLFSLELFLFFIAPIFYTFSALVKDRAKTMLDLKEAMIRIEQESTIKNNFITVLAHELRNPLAPVKTTFEILREMKLDSETQKLVENAHLQVYAMSRLLDDLLDVNRITQGKFKLQIEHAHLRGMIERSIISTKSLVDKGHEFHVVSCDETLWIDVDPVRFEQALVNILNNAAKYTNPGGRIELSCILKSDHIEISIKDNGIGIPPENLTNIFVPFWQALGNPASGNGVGIGLSLTKHIVSLHGGTIRAESGGNGQGSTFTLSFPLSLGDIHKPYTKNVPFGHVPLCKILVVDDNHAAADSLNKLLSFKGHTVRVVYSGKVVSQVEKEFMPDIILLDIGLKDMSGYEVSRELRTQGYQNKIIALSGYGQKEDKEAALRAGCDFHITKPMALERLQEYIVTTQSDRVSDDQIPLIK